RIANTCGVSSRLIISALLGEQQVTYTPHLSVRILLGHTSQGATRLAAPDSHQRRGGCLARCRVVYGERFEQRRRRFRLVEPRQDMSQLNGVLVVGGIQGRTQARNPLRLWLAQSCSRTLCRRGIFQQRSEQ